MTFTGGFLRHIMWVAADTRQAHSFMACVSELVGPTAELTSGFGLQTGAWITFIALTFQSIGVVYG